MVIICRVRYNRQVVMVQESCKYTPYYCEENIWHLCQDPQFKGSPGFVIFISNPAMQCVFYKQKNGIHGDPVVWDYHVIFLSHAKEWVVWDLDTLLPFPCPFQDYLSGTFPGPLPEWISPLFKVIPARNYIENFYSDRSHMRDLDNGFTQPPPEWPPIRPEKGNSLQEYCSMVFGRDRVYSINEITGGSWCACL